MYNSLCCCYMQGRVLTPPIMSAVHMATVLASHRHVSVMMAAMTEVIAV